MDESQKDRINDAYDWVRDRTVLESGVRVVFGS